MDKLYLKILSEKKKYAKKNNFQLNPDKKILNFVIAGLVKNKKEKGAEYCPCRPLEGNPEKDKKKICPCFWHKKEIEKQGFCHCRLFYKK